MNKTILRRFISRLDKLGDKDYFLSTVAYGAAPTLTGIKPSALMAFTDRGRNLLRLWDKYKHDASGLFHFSFFELKEAENRKLVLLYDAATLEKHIEGKKNREFLRKIGYEEKMNLERSLEFLKSRFRQVCPHEIGVFLGIPVEDVYGFMKHSGEKSLFCSYWKVYHDPEQARRLFQRYDRAKSRIIHRIINENSAGSGQESIDIRIS